jgi:hypothetical protein
MKGNLLMAEKEKYGICTECGTFGSLNLKDDPSFREVEEDEIERLKKEAIEKNKGLLNK